MLSDYIVVYFPESNTWSIPEHELEDYQDYVAEPQVITLYGGYKIKGIPLVHFGTWGLFGVTKDRLATLIRDLMENPERTCPERWKSKKVAAKTAAFFTELKRRYPRITEAKQFDPEGLSSEPGVPAECFLERTRP